MILFFRRLVFIWIALLSSGYSNSTKTVEQYALANFQWAISKYTQSEGAVPKSWKQLELLPETTDDVARIEEKMPGFKKRHRFLRSDDEISFRNWSEPDGNLYVIAMSVGSVTIGSKSGQKKEIRSLVVRNEKGVISIVRPTEELAQAVFERAGSNLTAYTGSNGRWEPEPDLDIAPPVPESREDSRDAPIRLDLAPEETTGFADPVDSKNGNLNLPVWFACLIAFSLLGICVVIARLGRHRK